VQVLLPITAPLFVVFVKKLALADHSPLDSDALLYGFVCSGFSSLVIGSIYPADGKHYGARSAPLWACASTHFPFFGVQQSSMHRSTTRDDGLCCLCSWSDAERE
jgi:hypothetical protein